LRTSQRVPEISRTSPAGQRENHEKYSSAAIKKAAEIDACLLAVQAKPVDMGGYYHPDKKKVSAAMRPCPALNAIIDAL